MNKKLFLMFALSLFVLVLFALTPVSSAYGYSYTDSYSKKTTYTPYGKTIEIRKDSPVKTTYYYSEDYYNNHYSQYNSVNNYWQYGPSANYYYDYPRTHYISPHYSDNYYLSSYDYRGYYVPNYYNGYYHHRY